MLIRPFNSVTTRVVVVGAFLALAALLLLSGLSSNSAFAQDAGIISYAENGMDPVATFTGTDPEGRPVYWSVLPVDADVSGIDDVADTDHEDGNHFMINSDGVLRFRFSPDFETDLGGGVADDSNTYNLVVVAADDAPGADAGITESANQIKMSYHKVTVNVTDEDEPGMVTLSVQKPQIGVALTATLTDDDATPAQITAAEWMWEHSDSKNGPWTPILTATTNSYSPLGVVDKYLQVTATYDDGHGSDKSKMVMSANMVRAVPSAANAPPTFPMGSGARSVDENSPPGTNVGKPVAANDVPGDTLTYTLSGDDDGSYEIDRATGQITVGPRTALDHDTNENDMVTVKATDPYGDPNAISLEPANAVEVEVTITISDVNEAPMITAGATKASVPENTLISTAVSTYTATDVDAPAVDWSVSGTDAGDFEISSPGELTFKEVPNYEMPADANGDNVYMVTVVATDAGVDSKNKMTAERTVVVTVTNAEEDGTVTLTSLQPKVGIPLTASVTDLDGGVKDVTWQWYDDTIDENDLTSNAIADATSDIYTPVSGDVDATLSVRAMYTDGQGSDSASLAVTNTVVVNTANVAPKFPDTESGIRKVAEGTAAGTDINDAAGDTDADPVAATDANPADTNLTYTLGGADMVSFDIVRTTGQLQTKAKLDYETKKSYMVTVTVADPNGASASIDVTIMVTNEDEPPVIAGDDITKDYPEKGTAQVARFTADDPEDQMIYWSLPTTAPSPLPTGFADADFTNSDAADFSINSDGVLSFNFPPDYEMPMGGGTGGTSNTYNVVVAASDDPPGAGTAIMVGYKKVTVNVTNVQETETITLSVHQGQVEVLVTATYNDLDNERAANGDPALTWTWYLGGSPISGAGGTGTDLTSSYAPENSGSHKVEASYTRTDGSAKTVSKTINVRTEPTVANAAPVFPTGSGARSVDENSPPGTNVGRPVAANDVSGDTLTYTLTEAGASSFDINPATGQITVAPGATLDRETTPTVTVTVTATDPWGAGASPSGATPQTVAITINDVNEAPMITDGFTRNSREEYDADDDRGQTGIDAAKTVDTYMATDVDQTEAVSWSVSGTDAGDFEISTDGVLTFKEAPNYEMPADANGDNVYMVIVVATDAGVDSKNKMTAERAVVVTITNVDEDGTVTLSSEQPKVGIALTATLEDPDGVVADSVKWTWHDAAAGSVADDNAIAMATSDTYTPEETGELSAKASYTDGHGANKEATKEAANEVVENTANVAPKFPDTEGGVRKVQEGPALPVRSINISDTEDNTDTPDLDLVRATDDNTGDVLTYALSGTDMASFDIVRTSGQLQTKAKLDYETKKSYMVTVTATDPDGASASIDVTIKVTDMDEAPMIMVGGLAISGTPRVDYAEDRRDAVATYTASGPDADMATWTLSGEDMSAFSFSSADGMLSFRSSPDYENPTDMGMDNMYMVTIMADDGTYMDDHDVMVRVTNVEELGRVTFWRDGVDATTAVIVVGDELGGAVDDSDGNPGDTFPIAMYTRITAANVTSWQWAKSRTPDMMASWTNIGTGSTYTVMDADDEYYLRATAMYDDGEGMGKMASMQTMMVTMATMNASPMFDAETGTREVAENTAAGMDIGDPVTATDADDDTLIYTLVGTDAASFDIDSSNGQLKTKEALDYETKNSYEVTVTATDPEGASDMITVTITVTDVDEESTLLEQYDENGNDRIDLDEVFKAIDDYFDYDDRLTLEGINELVDLYFES